MYLLERIISLVAPSRCLACGIEGSLLCVGCSRHNLPFLQEQCLKCQKPSPGFAVCHICRSSSPLQHVWSRTTYQGIAKQLVHNFKFERANYAANTIAGLMAESLPNLDTNTLVVAIPTVSSRYRGRGYDHAASLAKELAKQTGLRYCPLLVRLGQSRQVGASRKQRHAQLNDAFRLVGPPPGKQPVLLVDDVTTTGATLEAAALALKAANIRIINAITFANKPL